MAAQLAVMINRPVKGNNIKISYNCNKRVTQAEWVYENHRVQWSWPAITAYKLNACWIGTSECFTVRDWHVIEVPLLDGDGTTSTSNKFLSPAKKLRCNVIWTQKAVTDHQILKFKTLLTLSIKFFKNSNKANLTLRTLFGEMW